MITRLISSSLLVLVPFIHGLQELSEGLKVPIRKVVVVQYVTLIGGDGGMHLSLFKELEV